MRVLQLIDSLQAGGAERVAVNYANDLATRVEKSFLCATRKEGGLKNSLSNNVEYLFLKKNSALDLKAINKLNSFVRKNNIAIIHSHTSSYFIGTLIKIINPKIKLLWHEHYGNRDQTSAFSKIILKSCSYFFSCIITVNEYLKTRSKQKLKAKGVFFLPNYVSNNNILHSTILHGKVNKRVVCLANFRPDKDHINLLKAFKKLVKTHSDWSLHLVGQDFGDEYSKIIKHFIQEHNLEKQVFIYGSCLDVSNILSQSTIGVLSSKSEGLPLALLEYGLAKLPVVVTNVGDCNLVVKNDFLGKKLNLNIFTFEGKHQIVDEAIHIFNTGQIPPNTSLHNPQGLVILNKYCNYLEFEKRLEYDKYFTEIEIILKESK